MADDNPDDQYPSVFSLTHLTGRTRSDERRTVVLTVETKQSTMWVLAFATAASLPVAAVVVIVAQGWALLVPVLFDMAVLTLWETRQRRGMKLRAYQAILDRRRSGNSKMYVAGELMRKPVLVMHQPVLLYDALPASGNAPVDVGRNTRRRHRRKRSRAKELFA